MHRVGQQRRAIEVTTRLGGFFGYDYEFRSNSTAPRLPPGPSNEAPPAPPWLVRIVGVDYFANITYLSLPRKPSASDWKEIVVLRNLEYVHLGYLDGDDRDLAWLAKLPNLKRVSVSFEVSENAIAEMQKTLPNLKESRAPLSGGREYLFDASSTPIVTIR